MLHNSSERRLKGTNLKYSHVHNQRVVLETVRLRGPMSRAEISAYTLLTPQTISNLVDKLLDRRVLQTLGRRTGLRGQPAIELDINPDGGYGIGVHLDRDMLTVSVIDLKATCHQSIRQEWSFPTPDLAIPLIERTVFDLIIAQNMSLEDIWGVGVALPGPIDASAGLVINPPNFPGWENIPLRSILSERLNLPVFLETDATAAAEGERWFGEGRHLDDYLYLYFGLGVGGGLIVNGQPYVGSLGNAGMIGHLPVNPTGERCPCGGIGCLELYASLASLHQTLGITTVGLETDLGVDHRLEEGNSVVIGWIDTAANHLVTAIIAAEMLISPSAVIFGGHLPPLLQERLILEVKKRLPLRQMALLQEHPKLLSSNITQSTAALGAATLPLFSEFSVMNNTR